MRFAVMARILQYEAYGIQTALIGLLDGLAATSSDHEIVLFVDSQQPVPERAGWSQFRVVRLRPVTGSMGGKLWWDHVAAGLTCRRLGVDALYAPAHVRPLYTPCPTVVMIPDMMYHLFPGFWLWREQAYIRLVVSTLTSRASRIVALSESTRRDVLACLDVPETSVQTIYPGVPEGFGPLAAEQSRRVRERYGLEKPFVLSVGSFHPRKNLMGLLSAFERIAPEVPHDLVVTGSGWSIETLSRRIEDSPFAPRVRLLGTVERGELAMLYNEADVFVYPSLYEGFGLPALEAMACGCPVITTNASSLPEVTGQAAILVPPGDSAALAAALGQVLTDELLRGKLSRLGIRQSERFAWTATASQVLGLMEEAARMGR